VNNLVRIIGKAPSELSKQELCERLTDEHKRVALVLEELRSTPTRSRRGGPRKATLKETTYDKALKAMAQEAGMTPEEFMRAMEELKNVSREGI